MLREGQAYHRTGEGKGNIVYRCSECDERAVEAVDEGSDNKYTRSYLCRRCFEIAVEAKIRAQERGIR